MSRLNLMLLCGVVVVAGCRSSRSGMSEPPVKPAGPAGQRGAYRAMANNKTAVSKRTISPGPETAQFPSPFTVHRPAKAGSPLVPAPWISISQWARKHHVGVVRQISLSPHPTFELSAPRGAFSFQVDSLQAQWNGLSLWLGFPPKLINGQPCLQQLDVTKNLEPLLLTLPYAAPKSRIIVIDPGHGGGSTGTRSVLDGSFEKGYTLDWALRIRSLLTTQGWRVWLTRTNDAEVGLAQRVAVAEAAHADLFLSLHFNASGGGNHQAGLETYCLTPQGMRSTLTRDYPDDPDAKFPNNAFDDENLRLAACLHQRLLEVAECADRGIRRARFMTVLRGQNRPAVLIEGGYLSNPGEAARIADPDYRQKLAEAVAQALGVKMDAGE